eukprot:2467569-Ditylum_brightwellii.AAC.1
MKRNIRNINTSLELDNDCGYCCNLKICQPEYDTNNQKITMGKVCACHATISRRLSNWNDLSKRFRHSLEKHHLVFYGVLVIEQIKIQH